MSIAVILLSLVAGLAAGLLLSPRRRPARWLLGTLAFLLALVTSAHVIAYQFTGRVIDESVLYHLRVGLHGAGFSEYIGVMAAAAGLCLVSLIYAWLPLRLSRPGVSPRRSGVKIVAALPLLCLAWWVNPGVASLYATGKQYAQVTPDSLTMPESYKVPLGLSRTEGGKRKNLILIYVESLERGYFDEARFPGLLPRLKALEETSLSFTQLEQLPGLWWTIAGMVGSQCGIPLVTPPGQQEDAVEPFLPGAHCMGDLLAQDGYRLEYLAGANSHFAGKGFFLRDHGFDRVQGREQLQKYAESDADLNAWGVQDDVVFRQLVRRARDLHRQSEPFVLSTLTLGTHHPRGHVSASCSGRDYGDGDNPMLNAVHCTDYLLGNLIDQLRRQPGAQDTLIAVLSDHTAMRNTASALLEQGERRNTLMLLGDDVEAGSVERIGSQLDIAPTLLSVMGFKSVSLGLGRNLLEQQPSFVEANTDSHAALRSLFPRLRTLWGTIDLERGVSATGSRHAVVAGGREWSVPMVLRLDEDGNVSEVLSSGGKLASLPNDADFVWIDDCSAIGVEPEPGAPLCVAWGSGPEQPFFWQRLGESSPHWQWYVPEADTRSLGSLRDYWPTLQQGGVIQLGQEQKLALTVDDLRNSRLAVAVPNPGQEFVRWEGVSGPQQVQSELSLPLESARAVTPIFDISSHAESMAAEYRSAWLGVARVGDGVLEEQLSPGDTRYSVSRTALWEDDLGALELRAFGSYEVSRPVAFIKRDNETLLKVSRGLGLVVLSQAGEVVHAGSYDTNESRQESVALADTLMAVPEGHYVLLASSDDYTVSVGDELQNALSSLGFAVRF